MFFFHHFACSNIDLIHVDLTNILLTQLICCINRDLKIHFTLMLWIDFEVLILFMFILFATSIDVYFMPMVILVFATL